MLEKKSEFYGADELLDIICKKLQLNDTQYLLAQKRYEIISTFLNDRDSLLAKYKPVIYPQGSLRIGTTVKPLGKDEYDLDLICQLQAGCHDFPNPKELLHLIEKCLKDSKIHADKIDPQPRCVRLLYANQFHLDIVPACPSPIKNPPHIVIPDRKNNHWVKSNPKGFAKWFEDAVIQAVVKFRKGIEPLPDQTAFDDLSTLQKVVQLLKRNRDYAFQECSQLAPSSIVLTALAVHAYDGSASVSEALGNVLTKIVASFPADGSRLTIPNPSNDEDLGDKWDSDQDAYRAFKQHVAQFHSEWITINTNLGLPHIKGKLQKLFGEDIAEYAIREHLKAVEEARSSGQLSIKQGVGSVLIKPSPESVRVPKNTFYD